MLCQNKRSRNLPAKLLQTTWQPMNNFIYKSDKICKLLMTVVGFCPNCLVGVDIIASACGSHREWLSLASSGLYGNWLLTHTEAQSAVRRLDFPTKTKEKCVRSGTALLLRPATHSFVSRLTVDSVLLPRKQEWALPKHTYPCMSGKTPINPTASPSVN